MTGAAGVAVAAEFATGTFYLLMMALGLAAAILIDVTIVRSLLVPSAMKLFGHYNWWLPERAARIMRVPPSPLVEHRPFSVR